METYVCSFCSRNIEPGTGKMFVKKDGETFYFCGSKCEINMLKLHRNPKKVTWISKKKK